MTFRALTLRLFEAGVTCWEAPDGKLRYRAPNGLTPELRAAMAEHKEDLLFLCSGGVTVYGQGQEPAEWSLPAAPAVEVAA